MRRESHYISVHRSEDLVLPAVLKIDTDEDIPLRGAPRRDPHRPPDLP